MIVADLARVRLAQGAAEDGEVLREDVDEPPVDPAESADDAVAEDLAVGHAEIGAAVGDEDAQLLEAPGSQRAMIRSRAVSRPSAWIFSIFSVPPPSRMRRFRSRRSSRRSESVILASSGAAASASSVRANVAVTGRAEKGR